MLLGLIMILSASSIRALEDYNDSFYLFKHQLLWSIIGILALIFFMNLDYHIYQKHAKLILIMTLIALILVLIPGIGRVVGGSRRWIVLGPIRIQPSELAKLGMVIYLSQYFARKGEKVKSFIEGLLPPLIILGIVFLLILLEPDLGTAINIAGTVFLMLFVAGARYAHLGLLILVSIPLLLLF